MAKVVADFLDRLLPAEVDADRDVDFTARVRAVAFFARVGRLDTALEEVVMGLVNERKC